MKTASNEEFNEVLSSTPTIIRDPTLVIDIYRLSAAFPNDHVLLLLSFSLVYYGECQLYYGLVRLNFEIKLCYWLAKTLISVPARWLKAPIQYLNYSVIGTGLRYPVAFTRGLFYNSCSRYLPVILLKTYPLTITDTSTFNWKLHI